jgi:predicted regulator of Ras-like GTPase activity (Roadblock/LC7/MglB family)
MTAPAAVLDRVNAVRGVRGAVLVAADDGIVVAESLMEGVDGRTAVPCGMDLLLVAIVGPDANVGLARLELFEAAGKLA